MYEGLVLSKTIEKKKMPAGMLISFMVISVAVALFSMFTVLNVSTAPDFPTARAEGKKAPEPVAGDISGNGIPAAEKEEVLHIPLIVVDPGHGGEDEGCAREGVKEKDINLSIALFVKQRLTDLGYQVVLTREHDTYISKEARVEMANLGHADIFVSIHQNAGEETGANGIETWYYGADTGRDSKRLAQLINREAVESAKAAGRELRAEELYVTKNTAMPSCLVETGFLSNEAERQALSKVEYQEKLAQGIAEGIDLYFHPKTMYLTFDDGPSAENTAAVLDILKAGNIQATFFVIGEYVRKNPEVAKRIADEGHTIGVHCNRHDYEELYKSVDSYVKDFEEACQAVREVTGVEVKLFRFPGGSVNSYNKAVYKDIIKEMTQRGYIYFDWNASLEDAVKKATPEELIRNAVNTALGRKKVVLLAHDVKYNTALCLDELLDQFPEYEMKPLTPEVKPVQFRQ